MGELASAARAVVLVGLIALSVACGDGDPPLRPAPVGVGAAAGQASDQGRAGVPTTGGRVGLGGTAGMVGTAGAPPALDWRSIVADAQRPTAERVAAAVTGISLDPCAGGMRPCDVATYAVAQEHLADDLDPDERVLIIDDLGPSVDLLRHRHRVVGVFTVTTAGAIERLPASWELPTAFGDILTGFATFPSLAAGELGTLSGPLTDAYGDLVGTEAGHGITVHRLLTDRVPDRGMLYLAYPPLAFHAALPEVMCALPAEPSDAELMPLRSHAQTVATSLAAFLAEHHVSVINASFGLTTSSVSGPWMRTCGEPAPPLETQRRLLALYEPIFQVLFGTPGVVTVQAAFQGPAPMAENAPFDVDRPDFDRRLRVGSFAHGGMDVPAGGQGTAPPGSSPLPADPAFADVLVNSGCSFDACRDVTVALAMAGPYGFEVRPLPLNQSSFTAPVATAELVRRRRSRYTGEPWSDALIATLLTDLEGACGSALCFRDPLVHGGLPAP